jgi:RNA polymerase primary sigma factor
MHEKIYYKELNKKASDVVTQQRLTEMFKKYNKTKSIKDRDKIVECNLRYVYSYAKKFPGYPINDLISCGNIGLISAVERYDYNSDASFITYATDWIKHEMLAYIRLKHKHIKLPRNQEASLKLIEQIKKESELRGEQLTSVELLEEYNRRKSYYHIQMDLNSYQLLINASKQFGSLASVNDDNDEFGVINYISDDYDNSDRNINNSERNTVILEQLKKVIKDERLYYIMSRHFGFTSEFPISVDTIATDLGLTAGRVLQLIKKGTEILKENKEYFTDLI